MMTTDDNTNRGIRGARLPGLLPMPSQPGEVMPKTYYKTTIVYEVLHQEPLGDDMDMESLARECDCGAISGDIKSWDTVTVSGAEMAKLLVEQRSAPEFFDLDSEGNELCADCENHPCTCDVCACEHPRFSTAIGEGEVDECLACGGRRGDP